MNFTCSTPNSPLSPRAKTGLILHRLMGRALQHPASPESSPGSSARELEGGVRVNQVVPKQTLTLLEAVGSGSASPDPESWSPGVLQSQLRRRLMPMVMAPMAHEKIAEEDGQLRVKLRLCSHPLPRPVFPTIFVYCWFLEGKRLKFSFSNV